MTPPPRKVYDTDVAGLTFDTSKGVWRWRNRITGKRVSLGKDQAKAEQDAQQLNSAVESQLALQAAKRTMGATVGQIIDVFIDQEAPRRAWSAQTRKNCIAAFRRFAEAFGDEQIAQVDRIFLGSWLEKTITGQAHAYNLNRQLLITLWDYAISKNLCNTNEPETTLRRSTSRKIQANKKQRTRMTLEQFWLIHEKSPAWLQIAMELSLLTLQARKEIVSMKYSDCRDGRLYVVRQKTAAANELAFISLELTPAIAQVIAKSRDKVCPYIVHADSPRTSREALRRKPHLMWVSPDHLTKTFKAVRDDCGLFEGVDMRERPTFHEIRSLGGRLLKRHGYGQEHIKGFYGHENMKVTERYLENPWAITDDDFHKVDGGLSLADIKTGGQKL